MKVSWTCEPFSQKHIKEKPTDFEAMEPEVLKCFIPAAHYKNKKETLWLIKYEYNKRTTATIAALFDITLIIV